LSNNVVNAYRFAGAEPMPVSNPHAHYDASDLSTSTVSGGYVSVWADLSGNGYDLIQATGARQPAVISGGAPSGIDCLDTVGGRNMSTASALTTLNRSVTWAFCGKIPTNDGGQHFVYSEFGGAPTFEKNNGTDAFSVAFGITTTSATGGAYLGAWHQITVEALASGTMNCLVDNVSNFSGSCSGSFDPLCIGAHGGMKTNSGTMWNDELGEVLLFDRQLNATESSDLTAYLKAKWGF
jgi:hypothetical protein